jgi:hypothetical protein
MVLYAKATTSHSCVLVMKLVEAAFMPQEVFVLAALASDVELECNYFEVPHCN